MNTRINVKKTVKNICKFCLKSVGIMAILGIVGILLLALSYTIPVNPAIKESTFKYSGQMGWAPLVNNRYAQYTSFFTSFEPSALDDATDLIILNNCFAEGEGDVFKRVAIMNGNAGRYWHGYVSILRPIFHFIDYWDFLLVNSYLQLFVMGCVGYGVYKETQKKRYLFAFVSSCIFLTPAATAMSLQYTPVFYISMLGSLFCLLKSDWILQKSRRYYTFLILGIITCYFDFLTYPLLSFAFPFCWLMIAAKDKIQIKEQFQLLFGGGLSYIFGFGGFFVTKWIVQAFICGKAIFQEGISVTLAHLGGSLDTLMLIHQAYGRFDTLYNNFRHYLFPVLSFVLAAWMFTFVFNYLRGAVSVKADKLIFAAVTLTSLAWYIVMSKHTTIHHFFTHRTYGASFLGFMLFVCVTMTEDKVERKTIGTYAKKLCILVMCFVIGVGGSRFAKEDWTIINGGENTELHLQEGDILEFEFMPSIKSIKGFSFCIRTKDSTDGYICIDICDGDEVCASQVVPIEVYKNTVFEIQLAEWNLEAGKEYVMKTYIDGNSEGVNLLLALEGDETQTEYGKSYLNGEELGEIAPLSGITYRGNVQTKPMKLFLSGCVATFVLMWALAIPVAWKNRNELLK